MDWAFAGVGSFSTMGDEERLLAVREAIEYTRGGGDGVLVGEACHVACGEAGEVVGAALVTMRAERDVPLLTWIFVSPLHRRRGVGRGLLGAVAGVLRRRGFLRVESVFEVGNVGSMMWHWGMGFELMERERD